MPRSSLLILRVTGGTPILRIAETEYLTHNAIPTQTNREKLIASVA